MAKAKQKTKPTRSPKASGKRSAPKRASPSEQEQRLRTLATAWSEQVEQLQGQNFSTLSQALTATINAALLRVGCVAGDPQTGVLRGFLHDLIDSDPVMRQELARVFRVRLDS